MLGLCPQIECGRPRSLPAVTKNQKSASGTLSWSRTVGRNSETYCATRVGDGEGGIRFAIPPYELFFVVLGTKTCNEQPPSRRARIKLSFAPADFCFLLDETVAAHAGPMMGFCCGIHHKGIIRKIVTTNVATFNIASPQNVSSPSFFHIDEFF